ncbi:MMPL family transporter [Streptomyces sp. RFCAC02]|uniref:MMPL family transporter n=1 Tax=Streptomyces sp. RFCAC02 TaxID=2499143 RepID=UPI001020A909|nr:MMPL family transporter [Streptomyces sp. RFCAC02]
MGATLTDRPPTPPPAPPRSPGRRRALPWAVIGLWIAVLALALPFAGKLGGITRDETTDYLPGDAESTRVVTLQERMPGGDTTDIGVVYRRDGGLTAADRERADELTAGLAAAHDAGPAPEAAVSDDGTTALYSFTLLGLDEEAASAAVEDFRERVRDGLPDGLTVNVGGPAGLGYDSEAVFESADRTLMLATVAVVAVLLVLTYRSPVLWLLPLMSVGVAAMTSMAALYLLAEAFGFTVTTMSSSIMTVLVFGAGTDYALLLTARYREELRRHHAPADAMLRALRGCGPALIASSGTVAAGLLCLLAAGLNSSRGLGPVGAVAVACSLAAMTTLLPALLVVCGRKVFWPLVPAYGDTTTEDNGRRGYFARMGGSVSRRPVAVLAAGAVLLGGLALGVLDLPGAPRSEDTFTDTPESITAMTDLAEAFPGHGTQPLTVMARTGSAADVVARAEETAGVDRAEEGRSGEGWTEIAVWATDPPESDGEKDTVDALRSGLDTVSGADAVVGGSTAEQLDLARVSADDQRVVIPLVLGVVLLILIALLRGVVAPVLLLGAVVASWGAALGLGALVYGPVFGLEGMDPGVPLITFVFCVALGVDYGIFLMHRLREETLGGLTTRQASLTALRTTGGVIASAGLVLAATFGVLMSLPMVMMFQMGFVVAVGVLLDTFLVRPYILTAVTWLLGRRVWWPGPMARRADDR